MTTEISNRTPVEGGWSRGFSSTSQQQVPIMSDAAVREADLPVRRVDFGSGGPNDQNVEPDHAM